MRRTLALSVTVCALLANLLAAGPPAASAPDRSTAFPALRVRTAVPGLSQPWDVKVLPGGRYLITERDTHRLLIRYRGVTRRVAFPSAQVWSSGETGLMSLAVDPNFSENRRIYTCQGGFTRTGHDVRVVAWRMNDRYTGVRRIRTVISGLPASSGRHGGCRLLIARSGALLVGTGDAARYGNSQNLDSLGGKVLRLNRFTGKAWPSNRWAKSTAPRRFVLTYGHRNVQGLAQRADGTLWSVEHGPGTDDEVNRLTAGGNYGWAPGPGYDESVPMTDFNLPGPQVGARWSSGSPTVAPSGAAWVSGSRWGSYAGTLAVACLKGSKLMFLRFRPNGTFVSVRVPVELTRYGRLRSVTRAPNGDLLVTTANGLGDRVLRVSPR